MITNIKSVLSFSLVILLAFSSCKKEEYSLGNLTAPTGLKLSATVAGVSVANPNGDGTGKVAISASANSALTYNVDFGDGNKQTVPSGTLTYKYSNPGTYEYNITVNAIGTGGIISTITKKIKVFVAFEIPAAILTALTNGSSRVWVTDKDAPGHVGVGPADQFSPIWYAAPPNARDACLYDDEITFSKDASNNVSISVDNKGQTFIIGAATTFYGQSGGDGCYTMNTGGTKKLAFMDATSASTPSVSTRIQFMVPGDGVVNFATGGKNYEILEITATTMHIRNIGADGNAWYQKLKVK